MDSRNDTGRKKPPLDPARVTFVLVGPQSPGNAGSVARALKNLGFSRMALVRPHFELADPEALKMAVSARDVLLSADVFGDLDPALGPAQIVIGASRRRGRQRRPHWRLDRFVDEVDLPGGASVAVMFGREDSGLTDDELDRCTHLIHLPGSEAYASFNLAQAVLLVAYELRLASVGAAPPAMAPPADHAAREAMFSHLAEAFLSIGFVHADTVESIMRRLRRMLGRAVLSDEDVKLLRGLARQTLWAAGRAGIADVREDADRGGEPGTADRVDRP